MKILHRLAFCLLLFPISAFAQTPSGWDEFVRDFCEGYRALELPGLRIAYVQTLEEIKSQESLQQQKEFFQAYQQKLSVRELNHLDKEQLIEAELMQYLLRLNEERTALEEKWLMLGLDSIPQTGLSHIPLGREWYLYLLKRWIDLSVEPQALFDFGVQEVEKVKREMEKLRLKSGQTKEEFLSHLESKSFFYQDPAEVQQAFEDYHLRMMKILPQFFPAVDRIPALSIQRGTDKRLAQVPGFYRSNTFFYNFFDEPFNKRQIAWLYLHEANPGHHYQSNFSRQINQSPLQSLFFNSAYSEGWAAYVEEIGKEFDAYKDIYDEYGKWEWDLIRSVRVPLDIGLNYHAWPDEKALAFWKSHIKGKDDIGLREIARMKRWPAQVITYKYGARQLLEWKAQEEHKEDFNLKAFHQNLLQSGPLPYSILDKHFFSENR